MRVQISARRCEVPDAVRGRTEDSMNKLTRYDPGLSSAEVVFETEKHLHKVEAVLTVDRHEPIVARGEGLDFRSALDQMVDRLSRRLRRRRSQARKRQAPRPAVPLPEVVAE